MLYMHVHDVVILCSSAYYTTDTVSLISIHCPLPYRIRKMSDNCAVLWVKKLAGGLSRNLESAAKSMCTSAAEIEPTIEEQLEKHSQITQQLKDLEDKRRDMKTAVEGVRDHMDQAYEKDLEVEPVLSFCMTAE